MTRPVPYLSFDIQTPTGARSPAPALDEPNQNKKRWYHYLPVLGTVALLISPHPSLLIFLVKFYLQQLHSPLRFAVHFAVVYITTFITFSSFIICVARDPGPVGFEEAVAKDADAEDEDMSLAQALMAPAGDDDFNSPEKWCRRCWAPRYERTHHCSHCGRCVLKMDHHCPWIGTCVGHRTQTAFIHFLGGVTFLAAYIAAIAVSGTYWSFKHPFDVPEILVIHELTLSAMGLIFTVVIGSFWSYHVYLVTTNQTTIENISPFLLLRHLPPLPPSRSARKLSQPPNEDELSYEQRRVVRKAHRRVGLYNVGWRRNWAQVYGWDADRHPYGWAFRLLYGGGGRGDGRRWPRNAKATDELEKLATDIINADKDA